MHTDSHPIDAPASPSLFAAVVLIVIGGLLATAVAVHPRTGSVGGTSTETAATDTLVEWGD